MAKVELFFIDDSDEISDSFAIEGDFDDMKEYFDDTKKNMEDFTPEDAPEGEGEETPV